MVRFKSRMNAASRTFTAANESMVGPCAVFRFVGKTAREVVRRRKLEMSESVERF